MKRRPDAYREMARTQPYDVREMAPTSYLMAVAAGAPITALPIPMTRRFRHRGIQRRRESAIRTPRDLEGRRVGVRAYAVTAAVWTRGILADEYGVDLDTIERLTEEDENVRSFVPPANVRRVPAGQTLAALMKAGQLDAGFAGLGAETDDGERTARTRPLPIPDGTADAPGSDGLRRQVIGGRIGAVIGANRGSAYAHRRRHGARDKVTDSVRFGANAPANDGTVLLDRVGDARPPVRRRPAGWA